MPDPSPRCLCSGLPTGPLTGRQFALLLQRLQTSAEFQLVADRKIDWARYQQIWRCVACNVDYVLDYPFERGRGSFLPREDHPTVHLWEETATS